MGQLREANQLRPKGRRVAVSLFNLSGRVITRFRTNFPRCPRVKGLLFNRRLFVNWGVLSRVPGHDDRRLIVSTRRQPFSVLSHRLMLLIVFSILKKRPLWSRKWVAGHRVTVLLTLLRFIRVTVEGQTRCRPRNLTKQS